MHVLFIGYLVASAAATTLFIAAGLWTRRVRARETMVEDHDPGPAIGTEPSRLPADVRACALMALRRLDAVIRSHLIEVEVGVIPGLSVAMPAAGLTDLMEAVLTTMMQQAQDEGLCVTAVTRGEQIHIGLTGSAGTADNHAHAADFRSCAEQVAMQGGLLTVDTSRGGGVMVTIRLACASKLDRPAPTVAEVAAKVEPVAQPVPMAVSSVETLRG